MDQFYPDVMKNPAPLNKQLKLFWVGVGKDDALTGPGDRAFVQALDKYGVTHTFVEKRRASRVDRVAALLEHRRPAAVQIGSTRRQCFLTTRPSVRKRR